jgi:hypothetical protein
VFGFCAFLRLLGFVFAAVICVVDFCDVRGVQTLGKFDYFISVRWYFASTIQNSIYCLNLALKDG